MNNESIKEICDAVTPEILKLVQNIFSDLKKEIILEIKDEVSQKALKEIQCVIDKNANVYNERISELEKHISRLSHKTDLVMKNNENSNNELIENQKLIDSKVKACEKQIVELEAKVSKLSNKTNEPINQPTQRIRATAVNGINVLSAAQIEEILSFPKLCIITDDWIYYYKLHHDGSGYVDYGEIYKVKSDGTQNQKIFNGKAHYLFTSYFQLKGNMLYFHDNDNQERAIRI